MMEAAIPEGSFAIATNAFLLKGTDNNYILVDAEYGKELFNNLDTLGVKPEDITTILLTHTHGDHIGGLLKDDERAFPNAEIVLSRQELEFWEQAGNPKANTIREKYPIRTVELKTLKEAVLDNKTSIQHIAALGHTPGHTAFLVSSQGNHLLVWGDLTHAMAIQMPYPQVAVTYDTDPEAAVRSRMEILEFAAKNRIPCAGMHIPYPAIGTLKANGKGGYEFIPMAR